MEKENLIQLKPNVWKWQVGKHQYSLKKYRNIAEAEKIRFIHKKLFELNQSYILPIEPYYDELVIQQPWVEDGGKVQFDRLIDRQESLNLLNKLHQTGERTKWKRCSYLHEIDLIRKWEHRLEKWLHATSFLHIHLGELKTQQITNYAKQALINIKPFSSFNKTLLHGDVVHHNFVRNQKGQMYLIDFDLACIGPKEVELILWIHRVLPHLDYNLQKLIQQNPSLKTLRANEFRYLLFPNELLREWLYATTLSNQQLITFIPKLKIFTDKTLRLLPKLQIEIDQLGG
ncbi:MAG: phosphotransferase [Paenisporosarcina sp.]